MLPAPATVVKPISLALLATLQIGFVTLALRTAYLARRTAGRDQPHTHRPQPPSPLTP
ncbi:hypothetical protein [Nonomuraea sp. NPDC050786]|uniref:hypothetical protein n=1 Tax=Nonomuraea sp. NPDC050786 TaxID=3154840 RepID=UPI0034024160